MPVSDAVLDQESFKTHRDCLREINGHVQSGQLLIACLDPHLQSLPHRDLNVYKLGMIAEIQRKTAREHALNTGEKTADKSRAGAHDRSASRRQQI